MPRKFAVHILEGCCKGCGICVHFCADGVLSLSEGFTPRGYHAPRRNEGVDCKGCRNCELLCPDLAIFVEGEGK